MGGRSTRITQPSLQRFATAQGYLNKSQACFYLKVFICLKLEAVACRQLQFPLQPQRHLQHMRLDNASPQMSLAVLLTMIKRFVAQAAEGNSKIHQANVNW
jgi:hypothetical protein